MKVKEKSEKKKKKLAWNLAFKHKIMASSPNTSWQIEYKK